VQILNKISLLIQSSSLGISLKGAMYRGAWMCYSDGRAVLKNLFLLDPKTKTPSSYVKPLDITPEILENTALAVDVQGDKTLTKSLDVPFIKDKEIKEALPFLIDSQLTLPSDSLFFDALIIEKRKPRL
jgi:hypothetical protein